MKIRLSFCKILLLIISNFTLAELKGQFLVDLIDTTSTEEKGLWAIYRKTDHLQISGYFQPQFQVTQAKGADNYSGGNFGDRSDNRFMLRRARIRFDYAHFSQSGQPQAQVVFQFDGTERGVVIRDFWGRLYENKFELFSFTTGMFARPFGYEVNLSSGDREAPERGRMSQILMKTERDLGVMATFEPRKKSNPLRLLKFDVGIFNGQGLTAPQEFDSYKDIISRVYLKPYQLTRKLSFSAGLSFFHGGVAQNNRYIYKMAGTDGNKTFVADSAEANIGSKLPRRYRGVDAQLRLKHGWGKTELRGEYWWGVQTSSADQSETPTELLDEPYYVRNFNGAFLYLLQNIVNDRNQLILKYDFYDPNRAVSGTRIGPVDANMNKGDVKFNTVGFGYLYHFNTHLKGVLWYDMIRNEKTLLEGFTADSKDDVFTFRIQYRF